MTAVTVQIGPRPAAADGPETIEFVTDMDAYLESAMCSCNAGDDNPY
jgi:hypothetical protein